MVGRLAELGCFLSAFGAASLDFGPMRYLLATWEGGGVVPPELGIAKRLLARERYERPSHTRRAG